MANRIKITFTGQPYSGAMLVINIFDTVGSYTATLSTTFVSFLFGTGHQTLIGAATTNTIDNYLASLNADEAESNLIFSRSGSAIYVDFVSESIYDFTVYSSSPYIVVIVEDVPETPVVDDLLPLEIDGDISIEIIDTYENDRPLIVEYCQDQSAKISWDGGDNIFETIQSSKLVFNMLVSDAADGKFFHLFSGDEKRYKVKLFAIDAEEVKSLVWQGFLLPDFYEEPYENGAFFVNFTAVDMIGSLKGKKLYPWVYNNRLPIAEVFSYCLNATGIEQPIIVAPTLIPNAGRFKWSDINVPLYHYADDGKYADCYEILFDVLKAHGLSLCSFRGYWFIKGITRKHEVINTNCFRFTADGAADGLVNIYNKVTVPLKARELPLLTAIPPIKNVNLNVKVNSNTNILPDDVVQLQPEYIRSIAKVGQAGATGHLGKYQTAIFNYWDKVGAFNFTRFGDGLNVLLLQIEPYYVLEDQSLLNYYQCKFHPLLKANTDYNLNIEADLDFYIEATDIDFFNIDIADNWSSLIMFQIFMGSVEIASNRPSYHDNANFVFKVDDNGMIENNLYRLSFTLKTVFSSNIEDRITVRFLAPIWQDSVIDGPGDATISIKIQKYSVKDFKITPKYKETEEEIVNAERDINFTKEEKVDLNFTSNKNEYFQNNFGIGAPTNPDYYTFLTPLYRSARNLYQWSYTATLDGTLAGKVFLVQYTESLYLKLFGYELMRKNLFLDKATGERIAYDHVAIRTGGTEMALISSVELKPTLPRKYAPLPDLSDGDVLRFMHVNYSEEYIPNRERWRLWNGDEENSFLKTLAKAYHFTRPVTSYSMETTFLQIVFPNELVQFNYYGELRNFIPTRIDIDLFAGKTAAKNIEAKYETLTDITYD